MSRRILCMLFAAAVLVAVASPAGAVIAPTKISKLTAKVGTTSISVSGKATFGGEQPVTIATDPTGDEPGDPASAQAGIDLTGVEMHQPDSTDASIFVIWHVTQLPPLGAVPEAVRYLLDVFVNGGPAAGGSEYLIQAKYSNLISSTEPDDPEGHVMHIGNAFQMRGNCELVGVISSCHQLAWLEGAFDVANGGIYVKVPLGQDYDLDLKAGAVLTSTLSGFDTSACYQLAISNANTCDTAAWTPPSYTVPQKSVKLGIAKSTVPVGSVNFNTNATLKSTGSFSGKLSRSGLSTGQYNVWAKACFGTTCATAKKTVTL